ncbi:MAG: 16S rRNA (guanine(527)-N(7))-methyltransferase RsmG [Candidatus Dormibacteria bacterium]
MAHPPRVHPDPEQRLKLTRYLDELERWNATLNLTRVARPDAAARHLHDVLQLLSVSPPPLGARCVDVGSGAGIPGLPLAVLRPDLRMTLLEKDRRKCGFLTFMAGVLELSGVEVVTQRAEAAGHDPSRRESYDVAVSRATAAAPALCELCLPLLRCGGVLLAIVRDPAAAASSARAAALACGGGPPEALQGGVLRVTKLRPTDTGLPRRPGLPQRNPLGA